MALLASLVKALPTGVERAVVSLKLRRPNLESIAWGWPPMVGLGLIQLAGAASEPETGHGWDLAGAALCVVVLFVGADDPAAEAEEDCWRTIEDAAGVVLLMARRAAVTRVEDVPVRRALWTACRASIFCFGVQGQNWVSNNKLL